MTNLSMQVEQTKQIDLITMLGTYSQLRRKSSGEYEGPCPFCGGTDRLSVRPDGWFCRVCKPLDATHGWHSAIDFVRERERVDFKEAVQILTGEKVTKSGAPIVQITPERKAAAAAVDFDTARYTAHVEQAQETLLTDEAARAYLQGRGLDESTWMAYSVGSAAAVALPATKGEQKRPALVIPWYRAGTLIAVRYRFLAAHKYLNADGKHMDAKQTSRGPFRGALFGGQVLPAFCSMAVESADHGAERTRTLVLCEGEINTMSIWQVANGWRWDVLSVGSESAKLTDGAVSVARRYGRVLVWMDKQNVAEGLSRSVGGFATWSPTIGGKERDANDLLQAGRLPAYLQAVRLKACRSPEERQRVAWDFQPVDHYEPNPLTGPIKRIVVTDWANLKI